MQMVGIVWVVFLFGNFYMGLVLKFYIIKFRIVYLFAIRWQNIWRLKYEK